MGPGLGVSMSGAGGATSGGWFAGDSTGLGCGGTSCGVVGSIVSGAGWAFMASGPLWLE